MERARTRTARDLSVGLIVSLLASHLAVASATDSAERLSFWLDEGAVPAAEAIEWSVGRNILQPDEIPLPLTRQVLSVAVDGRVRLLSPEAHVRITLIDTDLRHHLVGEYYPLLIPDDELRLEGACRETCLLPGLTPHRLWIDVEEAELRLDAVRILIAPATLPPDLATRRERVRAAQARSIVARLNAGIAARGYRWRARETSYSRLPFETRRQRASHGRLPVMHGFEYYVGGIYEVARPRAGDAPSKTADPIAGGGALGLVTRFDWRSRHGANRPGSRYYDGDPRGSGWMTPVTQQQAECADCWAHAAVGALEAAVNLRLNRHRDVDLAEQYLLSCSGAGSCADGGLLDRTLGFVEEAGVCEETCFPYQAADVPCSRVCDEAAVVATVERIVAVPTDRGEAVIKRALIDNGPLTFGIRSWWHYMVLVGFERDALDGATIWLLKNSWGMAPDEWGENGYARVKRALWDVYDVYALTGVRLWEHGVAARPSCRDADRDGYAAWGTDPVAPAGCVSRAGIADCDDSDPTAGGADGGGRCLKISVVPPDDEPPPPTEPSPPTDTSPPPSGDEPDVAPATNGGGGGGASGMGFATLLLMWWAGSCATTRRRSPPRRS